jgi:hypothetical protein
MLDMDILSKDAARTRMKTKLVVFFLLGFTVFSLSVQAQTAAPSAAAAKQDAQRSTPAPVFSGYWAIVGGAPSWDPSDPRGTKPEGLPMTPWAMAKLKAARPPFGANATFDNTNDAVQKYCDPPGVTRLYEYPWQFTLVQTPDVVYILYEFTGVWRPVALNRDHPKDPDSTWMGDSIGRYEGDTFVVDTIGFNDKTWIDQVGHPHSDALHLVERFRRLDHDTLELTVTFDDPKAYTKSFTGKKTFKLSHSPMEITLCSLTEMQSFQEEVMKPTTESLHK